MQIFFKTRTLARKFNNKANKRLTDNGTNAPAGKRWAVTYAPRKGA